MKGMPQAHGRSIAHSTTNRRQRWRIAGGARQAVAGPAQVRPFELLETTIPELQSALATGTITSRALVEMYVARIAAYDQQGPALRSSR
jgi:amidase